MIVTAVDPRNVGIIAPRVQLRCIHLMVAGHGLEEIAVILSEEHPSEPKYDAAEIFVQLGQFQSMLVPILGLVPTPSDALEEFDPSTEVPPTVH